MADADLIVLDAKVIALDHSIQGGTAIGVADGRIAAIGSDEEILQLASPRTCILHAGGKVLTPGLFDAHPHMDRQGLRSRGGLQLSGCESIADILDIVRAAVERTPDGEWIVCMPMGTPPLDYVYRPEQLRDGRFPTRHDLDTVAPCHPVYIRAPWGWWSHRPFPSIANSTALAIADVTATSMMPYNTEAVLDATGTPTGVFLDRNYAPVLEYTLFSCVPRLSYEDRIVGIRQGAAAYSAAGTTSGYEGHGLTPAIIDGYRAVNVAGDLSVRITAPLSVPTAAFGDAKIVDTLKHWATTLRERGTSDRALRLEGVAFDVGDAEVAKIIGKGYPYEQWAGHFYQSLAHERFVELGTIAARLGLRVNCIVAYDLERVLRAFEEIDRAVRIRERRWVIVHVTQASPEQIQRIKALGLVATFNPGFMYMATDRFGLDQLGATGTPIRNFLDAGIPSALSTDNVPHSMFFAMWQALSRWDNDSKSNLGPSNLTREEVLRLATADGHYLNWEESERGTLKAGQAADFILIDRDPLSCDEIAIKDAIVERTFVDGVEVYAGKMLAADDQVNAGRPGSVL